MMVSSEASSWASATALRTACPGIEPGRSSLLTSAFVSMTTRSLVSIGKDFGQLLLGHPSHGRTLADAIAEALKLVCVERAQPVVFLRRENHSNVALFAAYHDASSLLREQKASKALFGVGS